jgi:hypothetical protein
MFSKNSAGNQGDEKRANSETRGWAGATRDERDWRETRETGLVYLVRETGGMELVCWVYLVQRRNQTKETKQTGKS